MCEPEFTFADYPLMDDRLSNKVLKSNDRLKQEIPSNSSYLNGINNLKVRDDNKRMAVNGIYLNRINNNSIMRKWAMIAMKSSCYKTLI